MRVKSYVRMTQFVVFERIITITLSFCLSLPEYLDRRLFGIMITASPSKHEGSFIAHMHN